MARVRMTREERQAETRREILAAAERQFLAHGYVRASLDEIAASAGYSKGAVYSNFASKEDLFLEVSAIAQERRMTDLFAALDAVDGPSAMLQVIETWLTEYFATGDDWAVVDLEFSLQANHEPNIAREIQRRHLGHRKVIQEQIERYSSQVGLVLPRSSSELADAVLLLTSGVLSTRQVHPDLPVTTILLVLRALLGLPFDDLPTPG